MQEERKEMGQLHTPEEITSWYIPHRERAQEVVEMYVQQGDLPLRARPLPAKRRRKGLWIFGAAMALIAVGVGIGVGITMHQKINRGDAAPEENDASSIVKIYDEQEVTIPRAELDSSVRLSLLERTETISPQEVYSSVADATVMVVATVGDKSSVGTGVIFNEDGYIITNAHVLAGADSATVVVMESYVYIADLVGYDIESDIAVLKIYESVPFPAAQFANSDDCRVGDTVYAIGNPLGVELQSTFTDGMISAINRSVTVDGHTVNTLQTTAAINSGNSGGPLINDCGQVIGINTLKMSNSGHSKQTATIEGLGFALPSTDVLFAVNDIMATGEYRGAPSFGMTVADRYIGGGSETEVTIITVGNGGGAFNAALQPGDVILAVDGQPIRTVKELQAVRRTHVLRDVVKVTYRRGTQTYDVEVTLYSNR